MLKCVDCKYNNDCTKTTRIEMENCTEYYPLTNADRIRAMSDEELANEIARYAACLIVRLKIRGASTKERFLSGEAGGLNG